MAAHSFSALSDGQAISFDPNADVLNLDETAISAASLGVVAEGTSVRITSESGKSVVLLNVSPLQLATSNVTFANGSLLLFGDNSAGTAGDNNANTLNGTSGNDLLQGFGGADTLNGGLGNDSYIVGSGDVINDTGGVDTIFSNISWNLGATSDNLTLTGTANINGNGNALANLIVGNSGNNTVWAGNSSDTVIGGDGNDYLGGDAGEDWVEGGKGIDTLSGGSEGDHFIFREYGAANADSINPGAFSSNWEDLRFDIAAFTQLGTTGRFAADDARFYAAAGANAGHDGDDRIVYNTTTGQLWYDADGSGSGAAQLIATVSGAPLMRASDLWVIGAPPASGAINGGPGDDLLEGTDDADSINGLGGNDSLLGHGGNDTLDGGDGNDQLDGDGGDDLEIGGAGNDILGTNDWNHSPWDIRDLGSDTLDGGLGDDTFFAQPGDTLIDEGGVDTVMVQGESWTLAAGLENLTFFNRDNDNGYHGLSGTGNELNNTIDAHQGADGLVFHGLAGNDSLIGTFYSDTFDGGTGRDTLDGASFDDPSMPDVYLFTAAPGTANADALLGFESGVDKITLDGTVHPNIGASSNFIVSDGRFYAAPGASSGHDATDRVVYDTTSGNLWYDADGSGAGAAQLIATLQGAPAVHETDITVANGTSTTPPTTDSGVVVTGTAADESLNGTPDGDTIDGAGGNDTINGLGGNDSLLGGTGNDSLLGGDGADSMDGGLGDDTFIVTAQDTISDAGGIDTVVAHSWTLGAGFENLTLVGDGSGGFSTGTGNALDNVIVGDVGGNLVNGGDGNDRIVDSGNGFDHFEGGNGNDTLAGGGDTGAELLGGAGDDQITVRNGTASIVTGGTGVDAFIFARTPGGNLANAPSVSDFVAGTEKIELDGSFHANIGLSGNFSAADPRFFAAAGATSGHDADDRVIYDTSTGNLWYDADGNGAGAAQAIAKLQGAPALSATDIAVINGQAGGGQTLAGTGASDTLVGGPGNDTLDGDGGVDSMNGQLGDDTYFVTAGDTLSDPGGVDTVMSDGSWSLAGGFENLTFLGTGNWSAQGTNDANVITGNSGNNYINARAGDDTIAGGEGNDSMDISTGGTSTYGSKVIDGGGGFDTIDIDGYAKSAITVNLAAGTMSGGGDAGAGSATLANIERVIGGGFNDRITGNGAANVIDGRLGNDTIAGAGGVDTLWGGGGSDSFVYAEAGSANADALADFASGTDHLLLDDGFFTAIGAAGTFGSGDGRFYAAAGASSGHDANDRLVYNTSTGQLWYDEDGSGAHAAVLVTTLVGSHTLAATDITVI